MSSPISFSGFNNIDFNSILESVMAQERQPFNRLQAQKTTLETQSTHFGTLAGKLGALNTAVDALRDTDSLALVTATSSDTGVGVSATSGTVAGSYAVVVSELARPQVLTSTSTYTALTDVAATAGGITFTPAVGAAVTVTLSGSTTIQGLANAINAETTAPVTAAVVQTSPGVYKLVLTSKETGTDNAFTVTKTLSGGGGVTFTDTDTDGTYGDTAADNTQTALNASLTVNGLTVSSLSNTIEDVVPGVTLTLKTKDPATTVTIGVTRDLAGAKTAVNKFITAYNDLVTFSKDQALAAVAGKASIARDPVLQGLRSAVGDALRDDYATGGTLDALGKVGIGFDTNGKLTLDGDAFETALTDSVTDVQGLFSGTDGTGGAFGTLDSLITEYTQAGGLLASAKDRISLQVSAISNRLNSLEAQLAVRRQSLQQQYTAADLAMTRLKSQSSSLSSLGGQYRLF